MSQIVESNIKGALENAKSWKHNLKNIKILSIDMGPTKHWPPLKDRGLEEVYADSPRKKQGSNPAVVVGSIPDDSGID